MKKTIILLISLTLPLFANSQDNYCDPTLADVANKYIDKNGGVWLKDFNISLPKSTGQKNNPEAKYSMVLSSDYVYRFLLTSSLKYSGDAQLIIQDKSGNIIALLKTKLKNIPESSDIDIKVTDTYHITVNFLNGNEGCANFTICYINKKN
jgi:hypothetical protein